MTIPIAAEPVPLEMDAEGVMRIGRTRVTLDTMIAAFVDGATAEEIVQQYPSLNLADVYAVIAYYLRRRSEVGAYLQRQRDLADKRVARSPDAAQRNPGTSSGRAAFVYPGFRFTPSGLRAC